MDELLITIAVPTYNNETTIGNAIESCLNQETEIPYEVLVVNNASTDGTKKVIEEYKSDKLKYTEREHTGTIYDNHNECLQHANGRYVIFCHSDDTLESHAVETFARKLRQRNFPKKYILFGRSMYRDFFINIYNGGFHLNEMMVGENAPMLCINTGLTPSGTCFSKDSLLELGGFLRTDHKLAAGDYTIMLYCAIKGFRFEMIDEMIFIRTYASTAVEGVKLIDTLDAIDEAFEHFYKLVDENDIEKLIMLSIKLKNKPFIFYYTISKYPPYRKKIANIVVKEFIKHPLKYRNSKIIRAILKRVFLS